MALRLLLAFVSPRVSWGFLNKFVGHDAGFDISEANYGYGPFGSFLDGISSMVRVLAMFLR